MENGANLKKCCGHCGLVKDLGEFPARKDSPDGHRNMCKLCCSDYLKNYHKNPPIKEVVPEGFKRCRKCNNVKPIDNFAPSKQNSDGLRSYCQECRRIESEEYRRSRGQKPMKEKRSDEETKAYKHDWYLKNKDKVYENKKRRRARKIGVEENYGQKEKEITLNAFEHKCFNCGNVECLCIDHHRPLIKGFALTLDNAVVLCKFCNSKKFDSDPEKFYGTEKCAELDNKLAEILENYKGEIL